jgi:FtsP/CotA-like multicopper oxidase with cupredoxin domain
MPMMNWATSGAEITWILRDPRSGADNDDIDWSFRVGDVVKVRVTNDRGAFHAMQHPLHIHGQRFLVLEQNGVRNENLVWKDPSCCRRGPPRTSSWSSRTRGVGWSTVTSPSTSSPA